MLPFLIIGLGNPGAEYAGNRHNAGFMAVDQIMEDYGFGKLTKKFGGVASEGMVDGRKTYVFCPMGYMNTSGGPAAQFASFYKIPPARITVIHDELDLPLGKLRVKRGGGHGGHNGLKSLDAHLGQDYRRIRFGIGHPGDKDRVADYVLSDFSKAEWPLVEQMAEAISKHLPLLLKDDEAGFMSKVAVSLSGSAA